MLIISIYLNGSDLEIINLNYYFIRFAEIITNFIFKFTVINRKTSFWRQTVFFEVLNLYLYTNTFTHYLLVFPLPLFGLLSLYFTLF